MRQYTQPRFISHAVRLYMSHFQWGVFGNEQDWIVEAIQRALRLYSPVDLDVVIVSYGSPRQGIQSLLTKKDQFSM